MPLSHFHPATRRWFEQALGQPTPAQAKAWAAIREGRHTLIAAPTGSGKTLAAFYTAIDRLVAQGLDGGVPDGTQVVYVSPLKALSNDIHRNLELPLCGIRQQLETLGYPAVNITVAVRTGDTTSHERQQMTKHPPHILVTTPESLYLLLTSDSGRRMLSSVTTIIIDEIHAMVEDKRGSHLALSVERLAAVTGRPLQRIGLSATQKPIELVARFLVGVRHGQEAPSCAIVDTGYRRRFDLRLEVPKSPLTAVMSNEVWTELYDRLLELVAEHRTTLIFVNTRRLAERLAFALGERIGHEHVSSHHGSMSKEHRHTAEQRLKAGKLKVMVATASMELGIDIGAVELVVQLSTPKKISSFLQRVGRSHHYVGGTPKGILFPLSRDDLAEGAALFDSVRRGELDHIIMPEAPLDVLSQQIVAEVAAQERGIDELFEIVRRAYPYRDLSQEKFLEIVRMLAEGFTTRRGKRGAYLHLDAINGRLRARRGARLVALTNGGAIPDTFDYEVVLQPEGITVGTLNEDFALESLAGDIFILGNHAWQLVRIEGLKVIVHDAAGKPPTVPFWLGEGPGRSQELSESVSRLRETLSRLLDEDPLPSMEAWTVGNGRLEMDDGQAKKDDPSIFSLTDNRAVRWLIDEVGLTPAAAEQLAVYIWMGKVGLGLVPTRQTIVMERFFDEAGDMHLVVHSPYGSQVNRGWGLALRKKFCRNFNFELQAAANENSIILSLSSTHSFPLEDVFRYLNTKILRDTLIQAMLDAPLFEIRWRWNATRALAIVRNRAGKRVPPYLQRMQAEDLIAQVFPDQIACAENIVGDRQVPEHPLIDQVIHDCLTEAMDIESLTALIGRIERKELTLIAKDLREPSVFAQEIINARPYAFLDDTEFAERRVNAIKNRSWLDPSEARDLSRLDPEAIARVKEEAWPQAQDADELHDVLMTYGFVTQTEGETSGWVTLFEALLAQGRGTRLVLEVPGEKLEVRSKKLEVRSEGKENPATPLTSNFLPLTILWIAAERVALFQTIYPAARCEPAVKILDWMHTSCSSEEAIREVVRGRLEALGPVTVEQLAASCGLPEKSIELALVHLENEGFVFRGHFTPELGVQEWCERRLLQRIHRYTIEALRQSIQPVSVQDFMRFLLNRHRMSDENDQPSGPQALQDTLALLEGYEAPAAAWEADVIPGRMADYDPSWLDVLCLSGKIVWGRFNPPKTNGDAAGKKSGPIKSTPICLVERANIDLWQLLKNAEPSARALTPTAQKILEILATRGASFFSDLVVHTGVLKSQVEEAIGELVAAGLIVNDSYAGLRALLTPEHNKPSANAPRRQRARQALFGIEHAGRWALMFQTPERQTEELDYVTLERVIRVYLKRWGVLFRSLMDKESFAPPWRVVVRVLRRMELRGELRGGRFVSQVSGEQFALTETVEELRRVCKQPLRGTLVSLSAVDPLNLLGILLPGKRIANLTGNRIVLRDGIALAVSEGKEVKFLKDLPENERWELQKILVRRKFPGRLRYYLGKNYV